MSCDWVSHPAQRHKIMQEPLGGINRFRDYYGVREPLRFHTSVGNATDEVAQYRHLRERPPPGRAGDGLKILLVGELAYNAGRVLALEELGHSLYGLWMPQPHWYNTVGPLPFGNVQDLPLANWRDAVRELAPDVIYALLNASPTRSFRDGRSDCIPTASRRSPPRTSTSIFMATLRTASGATGLRLAAPWRRGTCTCTPMSTSPTGCTSFRVMTRVAARFREQKPGLDPPRRLG
ncbi:MAG: hypothetical protein ABWX88_09680 [Pseudoxanthomonas sp.]